MKGIGAGLDDHFERFEFRTRELRDVAIRRLDKLGVSYGTTEDRGKYLLLVPKEQAKSIDLELLREQDRSAQPSIAVKEASRGPSSGTMLFYAVVFTPVALIACAGALELILRILGR
jgi:hypothetical protein